MYAWVEKLFTPIFNLGAVYIFERFYVLKTLSACIYFSSPVNKFLRMISLSELAGMENVNKFSQQVFLLHFQNLRETTTILDRRQAPPRDGNQQWNVDPT